jgi:GH15 family glucan-1,4-alpha-glucosidase
VRIGNGAYRQSQLDIYGGLLDSVYLYNKYGAPISYDLWRNLERLLDYVCANWRRPDEGIWEIRGEPRHFVYSKLMCWVALDRGVRWPTNEVSGGFARRWLKIATNHCEIMERGGTSRLAFVPVLRRRSDAMQPANNAAGFLSLRQRSRAWIQTMETDSRTTWRWIVWCIVTCSAMITGGQHHGREGAFSICSFGWLRLLTRAAELKRRA